MKKTKAGRKTIMTSETLGKLEYAFAIGCSDREACEYAGINPDSLYSYQKKYPEFSERKTHLKERVILKARKKIYDALDVDTKVAQWLLERLRPKEFNSKYLAAHPIAEEAVLSKEDKKRVLEIARQLGEDDADDD